MKELKIAGINCTALAKSCGTPLYVYDEEKIEEQLNTYMKHFKSERFDTEVLYASKAFLCKAMIEKVVEAGASLDVVSGGELYIAHRSGMSMDKVFFHGNNKSDEELELAFELGCKTIVLDNVLETQKVIRIAENLGQSVDVMLRINPGIKAHTHEYIVTAHIDSKFGISAQRQEEIASLVKEAEQSKHVNFKGFHSHIGSQITEMEAFEKEIELLVDFVVDMEKKHNIKTSYLNIGGGFGIKYLAKDKTVPAQRVCSVLIQKCEESFAQAGINIERVMIEPGRSIVGEAGYLLYTVGYQKETQNKHYLFVDGGMSDNIRPALYQAEYGCDLANKMDVAKSKTYCIAGKACESGDIVIQETKLPEAAEGDLLVLYSAGAYGYAMANNYNKINRPAVVFAKNGKARTVVKRESYEDLIRLDINEPVE